MLKVLLSWLRSTVPGRKRRAEGLTAIEYEAVTLIAYEGRDAYGRAREQADYYGKRGSPDGSKFWLEVAAEVALRTGRRVGEPQ